MSQIMTDKYEQPDHLLQKKQAEELRTDDFFQLSTSHLTFKLHVLIMNKRKCTDTTQTQSFCARSKLCSCRRGATVAASSFSRWHSGT